MRRRRIGPGTIAAFLMAAVAVLAILGAAFVQQRTFQSTAAAEPVPTTTTDVRPLAVFIGDSYSAGVGASSEQKRFVNRVAYAEGWTMVNLANGGTGYAVSAGIAGCGKTYCPPYKGALSKVAALHPDIVVVSGGRNDLNASDAAIDRAVDSFFPALRTVAPNATIYATSPLWDDSSTPARLTALGPVVRSAAEGVDGRYLDIGQPLLGEKAYVGLDSVHPSDLGHGVIAEAVVAALAKQ